MSDIVDLVQQREEILAATSRETKPKPRIVDETSCSRSTVDRAVRQLLEAGLLLQEGSSYRTTSAATRILSSFQEFRDEAELYYDARDALAGLPDDEELPPEVLDGADIELADPNMPSRPVKRALEGIGTADALTTTCPVLLAVYDRVLQEAIPKHGLEVTVIYSPQVLATIEDEYPERHQALVDTGLLKCYVSDTIPSYTFSVIDGLESARDGSRLNLQIHAEKGAQSTIMNDSPEAVAWGREKYGSLVEEAELAYPKPRTKAIE